MKGTWVALVLVVLAAGLAASAELAGLGPYGSWSQAVRVEGSETSEPSFNGQYLDGCPFISRDGKVFFMASRRPTGPADQKTDINIWVSTRKDAHDEWGAPTLVGPPVSIDVTDANATEINDFCPTLAKNGHDFYFVSNRDGYCGTTRNDDIYSTRMDGHGRWHETAEHLGCDVNTTGNEASPFPQKQLLYFSSSFTGAGDLYYSSWDHGSWQGREQVPGLNTPTWNEGQPNVRRDGLEIFYFSNQPDGIGGGTDIYSATRASTKDAFSGAADVGADVNSPASDTRPSLSWDGTRLYFGSTRPGGEGDSDHYMTTRERLR